MYPVICDHLFKRNTLIIGDRNCGKTTFLKQVINQAMDDDYLIIVFDSATDHVDKSILVYCKRLFNNYQEIKSPEKDFKVCPNGGKLFPYDILKDNQSTQIYLFDVSRYLEEGFLYETDDPMRDATRLLYKELVVQCLVVMYEFMHHSKAIVLMDEIEFIPDIADIIKKYNERGIFFINCLHTEESCDDNIRRLFDIVNFVNVYSVKLGGICEKDEDMLCGPACLHYFLNVIQKQNVEIPNDLVWITDIALFLSELKVVHELSCYDSNLYNDYLKGSIPRNHPAELSIRYYLATDNRIALKKFTKRDILYNRLPDFYFIASVKSIFLDNTRPEDSYHFILVHQTMDLFTIICPRKRDYNRMSMGIDEFVHMINKSGNWIIRIKQK